MCSLGVLLLCLLICRLMVLLCSVCGLLLSFGMKWICMCGVMLVSVVMIGLVSIFMNDVVVWIVNVVVSVVRLMLVVVGCSMVCVLFVMVCMWLCNVVVCGVGMSLCLVCMSS